MRRWAKFNLVGAMGMVVQLVGLALLDRLAPGHYVYASACAVEMAVLHNFLWHVLYTWRDRPVHSPRLVQFMRFQFSNGAVSLAGNVALMYLLVQQAHFPVLVANVIAIAVCSAVNFCLGNNWVFA